MKANIDYVCKKVGRKYVLMCRLGKYLTPWSKITIYKSMISPHFDYCASLLFLANDGDLIQLQKLQNKIMRVILCCKRDTSTLWMLETLQWQSIRQRIIFNTLVMIHKVKCGIFPAYLCSKLSLVSEKSNYNLRNKDNFKLPNYTKVFSQNSLFYKGINLYNNIPVLIKNSRTLEMFKKDCGKWVKESFPYES